MYPYGLIGNCQVSALVGLNGSLDWLCLPRPDSAPVFGKLLDKDGGSFSIEGVGAYTSYQEYLPNTTVLQTVFNEKDGSSFRITDFCPRFQQHGRMYRPISIFRIVEPLSGNPSIKVSCNPVSGWEKEFVRPIRGNSHLRYEISGDSLRLVTNMPLTYLGQETAFALKEPIYFGLTWSSGIEDDLISVTNQFLQNTIQYWNLWVKHCAIPSLYQKETIRSALTLKLHCYEDTGAILAALTTSLPEDLGGARNWDYRFCWLRDAYFVLTAFHNLGHFEEMEGFLKFLLNIAEKTGLKNERLQPVYRLDQSLPVPELVHANWQGCFNSSPVRSGNQAAEHIQNDVYGEMALTLSPIFLDARFHHLRTKELEGLLGHFARLCVKYTSQPDAGLWELRDGWQEHSFSNLMCWAGLDRISTIKDLGFLKEFDLDLGKAKLEAEKAVHAAAFEGALRNGPKDRSLDASLLLMSNLRFPGEDLCKATVKKIYQELQFGSSSSGKGFLYRYKKSDDFGVPKAAFLICSFWLVQALVKIGDLAEAKAVMERAMSSANKLGLFSEHYIPEARIQLGNFPQAYSHVGQINAAFSVSPPWSELL